MVYYEHAHHQHVYDEHDDNWGSSYWKRRSLKAADSVEAPSASAPVEVSYSESSPSYSSYRPYDEHQAIFDSSSSGSIQPPVTYTDPHSIVYSKQMPQQTYSFT